MKPRRTGRGSHVLLAFTLGVLLAFTLGKGLGLRIDPAGPQVTAQLAGGADTVAAGEGQFTPLLA